MTVRPLPFRPLPARDELLSSWIGRLAKANHCSVEELCGYLGLGQGGVPECASDLRAANWARLCGAVQLSPDEIAAMCFPEAMHHSLLIVSRYDFQHCWACVEKTPALVLWHWRFAWSLTCEICGQSLAAKHPAEAVSDRLLARAARGAQFLETAVASKDLRRLRRVDLTLHLMAVLKIGNLGALTSGNERERLMALAAVGVSVTRPILGVAIILRGNERMVLELRRAFPQHRRLIERVRGLSLELDQRLPGRRETEHPTGQKTHGTSRASASESALRAARQAISELGLGAKRESLLTRADAIWKRSSGTEH